MTSKLDASLFAGNQGISVKSDYGLWGTTTRKMKFRISSAMGIDSTPDRNQATQLKVPINFTDMPNVKRATLVPESFALSLNADPIVVNTTAGGIVPGGASAYWGLGPNFNNGLPYSQVCLRCMELSQPNSFDNGAVGVNGVPNTLISNHSSFQGQSNIIMSMPVLAGDANSDGGDRVRQVFRNYNGNEYDCGIELANNVFQVNELTFDLTNEFGQYYDLGDNDVAGFRFSWYAEFSIVYEPEKTEFDLN